MKWKVRSIRLFDQPAHEPAMQDSSFTLPQWASSALYGIAWLLSCGTIAKLIVIWQHRHKPPAEARLLDAQATEIIVRSEVARDDSKLRVMDRLDIALGTVDRLRAERDGWKAEYDQVFEQKQVLVRQNERLLGENKGYEEQIRRMRLTLKNSHLNYDGTQDQPVGPLD